MRPQTDGAIHKALAEHEAASSTRDTCVTAAPLTGQGCIRLALWRGHQIHSTNRTVKARRGKEMENRKPTSSSETLLTQSEPQNKIRRPPLDGRTRGTARYWWPWARPGATSVNGCRRRGSPSTCRGQNSHNRLAALRSAPPNRDRLPSPLLAEAQGGHRSNLCHLVIFLISLQAGRGVATKKQTVPLTSR